MPLLLAFGAGFLVSTLTSSTVKYVVIAGVGYYVYTNYVGKGA